MVEVGDHVLVESVFVPISGSLKVTGPSLRLESHIARDLRVTGASRPILIRYQGLSAVLTGVSPGRAAP